MMAGKFRAQLREVASTTNATTRNVIGQQVADASNKLLQRLPRKSALEQTVRRKRRRTEEPLYGVPFVKILYLTDLAQKLLSLAEIAICACRDVISARDSYLCMQRCYLCQR